MSEFNFDDLTTIVDYNTELWFRFLSSCEMALEESKLMEATKSELGQSLDLIRAVNSYRTYKTPNALFIAYPELENQREYVELLWNHFETLSQEELSNLVVEMIHEVSSCSPKLS